MADRIGHVYLDAVYKHVFAVVATSQRFDGTTQTCLTLAPGEVKSLRVGETYWEREQDFVEALRLRQFERLF